MGLYKVNKLIFGVKTAPNIWQRFMDSKIIKGIQNSACFFDDIIVGGKSLDEVEDFLELILKNCQKYNLHLNLKKCKFLNNLCSI